eukprot:5030645-Pyramimonas_sp.AAC.1
MSRGRAWRSCVQDHQTLAGGRLFAVAGSRASLARQARRSPSRHIPEIRPILMGPKTREQCGRFPHLAHVADGGSMQGS